MISAAQLILSVTLAFVPPSYFDSQGKASFYGRGNWHGEITASGERFRPNGQTCAHRTISFDTWVLIYNRESGLASFCRINDRGPYDIKNGSPIVDNGSDYRRVIDASVGVARQIGLIDSGVSKVSILKL